MMETAVIDLFENYHDKIGLHNGWIFDNFAIKPKQLARFVAALMRNVVFADSEKDEIDGEVIADRRIALFDFLRSGPVEAVNAFIYPFLHYLNPLFEGGNIVQIPLNASRICADGIYLMNRGFFSLIYVMPQCPLKYIKDIFKVNDYEAIDSTTMELDDIPKTAKQLQEILEWMRKMRGGYASQTLVLK
uniref:Uncharacterized protein n=1 Tax=Panagrolaimus sp. JU765 TaxID=591449 RepID=A0AC34QRP9_9BILA